MRSGPSAGLTGILFICLEGEPLAKLLLENARVYPMTSAVPVPPVGAVLLDGGTIAGVGATAELAGALGPGDHRVDLGGRTVVPGFIDAHVHLKLFSFNLVEVNLEGVPDLPAALEKVAARHRILPPGAWVRGWGFNANRWGRWPTRADLDAVCPDRPVLLHSKDGHTAWVNSRALALAGVHRHTPDPAGGQILREGGGDPVGLLQENAIALVMRVIPPRTEEETATALKMGIRAAHAVGCTGVHDVDGSSCFAALQLLRRRGELALRVVEYLQEDVLEQVIAAGVRTGLGDAWLKVGGIKMFSDGALGSQTAWMLSDYVGRPGSRGIPTHTAEEMRELVGRCVHNGLACAIHAIGDAANRMVLDAYATHAAESRRRGLRHRIEHAQHLHPADLPRFGTLGVVASVQPSHVPSDRDLADQLLGPERCRYAYAFRSLLHAGAYLACGSDVPVEALNPLAGLHAAVYRKRIGRAEAPWYPQEALTAYEALYGFTAGAAWAGGTESIHGSLAPGLAADLVVLSHDPLTGAEDDLLACQVTATILDGRIVYGELPEARRV